MKLKKQFKIALVFLGLFFVACSKEPKVIVGQTMGTTYSVKYFESFQTPKRKEVADKIKRALFEVNRQMSTYMFESEISALNRAKKDESVQISEDFLHVLNYSIDLAQKTGGVYDPTIGPLVNLWGFGPNGKRKVPSQREIENQKKFVGVHLLNIQANKISKSHAKVYVDLSSSAKGFGVDKVSEILENFFVKDYMVEIGGEIRTLGDKNGSPWKIAIERPSSALGQESMKIFDFSNLSIATSGSYRNFFKQGEKNYSHTINFLTGKPIEHHLASVSVVSPSSCMEADALSTALMAMGPTKAIEYAEKHKIAAYFILKLDHESEFKVKTTESFNQLFK